MLNFEWLAPKPFSQELGHEYDPFQVFAYLKTISSASYYLESLALPRHQDRYFTIGAEPVLTFSARGKVLTITAKSEKYMQLLLGKNSLEEHIETENPYQFLQKYYPSDRFSIGHEGGLIGYVTYEGVNYFEPAISLEESLDFSTFEFGLYTEGLIYDTLTGVMRGYSFENNNFDQEKINLDQSKTYKIPTELESIEFVGDSNTKDEFLGAVKNTQAKIREGYSFQAEVGYRSDYMIKGDKVAVYARLREVNPGPYMYYLHFGKTELLGSSPEILISSKQGQILTTPVAGTIKRGKTEEEDRDFARELLSDPKENAEHNMLVDLHRNDVARVSIPGSVRVSDLKYLIKFSHVQHIVSNIVGTLQEGLDSFDVLATILPGGVVCGAPKIETIKIIDQNEKTPRGPYGGAVGRFSLNGDCDFCLPIRSLFCSGDKCYTQTSAGVVYDSTGEGEYQEVQNKLAAMKETLRQLGEETKKV